MATRFDVYHDRPPSPTSTYTTSPTSKLRALPLPPPPTAAAAVSSTHFHPFAQPQHFLPIGSSRQDAPRFNEDIFSSRSANVPSLAHARTQLHDPRQTTRRRRGSTLLAHGHGGVPPARPSIALGPTTRKESHLLFELLNHHHLQHHQPQLYPQPLSTSDSRKDSSASVNPRRPTLTGSPARSRETRLLALHNLPRGSMTSSTRKESSTLGDLHNTFVRKESGTLPDRGKRGERDGSLTISELGEIYPFRASWLRSSRGSQSYSQVKVASQYRYASRYFDDGGDEDGNAAGVGQMEELRRESGLSIPGITLDHIWDEFEYEYETGGIIPDVLPEEEEGEGGDEEGQGQRSGAGAGAGAIGDKGDAEDASIDISDELLDVITELHAEMRKPSWDVESLARFPHPPLRDTGDTDTDDEDDSLHTSSTSTKTSNLATPLWHHKGFDASRPGVGVADEDGTKARRQRKGKARPVPPGMIRRDSEDSYLDFEDDLDDDDDGDLTGIAHDEQDGEESPGCEVRTIMGIPATPVTADSWKGFWSEPSSPAVPDGFPSRRLSEAERIREAYMAGRTQAEKLGTKRPSIM